MDDLNEAIASPQKSDEIKLVGMGLLPWEQPGRIYEGSIVRRHQTRRVVRGMRDPGEALMGVDILA